MNRFLLVLSSLLLTTTLFIPVLHAADRSSSGLPLERIQLPPGFHISLFAANVENARSMAWNGKDTLYVGTRSEGNVYALIDSDGDYQVDKRYVIADDLSMPNGIVYHQGDLYVAEVNRILKYKNIDSHKHQSPEPLVIYDGLPDESHHGWRYLNLGPDNRLYVSIGAPCNICDEKDYAVIARLNLDGSGFEIIARGIRNSVGFTWHPETKELWFTDNGRDMLGDDLPPDELNRVTKMGQHFGYPYCHGGFLLDPEYGEGKTCSNYVAPEQKLAAHAASLGLHIYSGRQFPESYKGNIFIAEHGSWNRSKKIGYRISLVKLKNNKAVAYENFATGWLRNESAWGRPVDIKTLPDGSLLVSDDRANAIYRIYYQP